MFGCCKKKNPTDASARVVDGKLILSLPAAKSPVVWQMDLAHAKASALEVQHHANDDTYALHLKTPKGEKVDVASFDTRDQALAGLMAASNALESAQGAIRPGEVTESSAPGAAPRVHNEKKKGRAGIIILALIALAILFTFWSAQLPVPAGGITSMSALQENAQNENTAGVPMSADAYLNNR